MSQKPRVLLVHPGTQHAPRLAEALDRRGLLDRFWTGSAAAVTQGSSALTSTGRTVEIANGKLRTRRWLENAAQLMLRMGANGEKVWHRRNEWFQRMVPDTEIESADVVVGFDTSSWILAERAKAAGKKFVLDQTVGHPLSRRLELEKLRLGRKVWPEAFDPRWDPLRRIESREHELADRVVVASSFSAQTLIDQGVPQKKLQIIAYGVGGEFLQIGATRAPVAPRPGPVFLFTGYLSERKGLDFLLEAWSNLNIAGASIRLAGGGNVKRWHTEPRRNVTFLGQTPRGRLLEEMKQADIFVFPSLFEGFALVLLEAMAAGLPVITTPNTAGPDLIEHGVEGLIIPAGDADALCEAMRSLGSDSARITTMGRAAHEKAEQYTWARYGEKWEQLILRVLSEN